MPALLPVNTKDIDISPEGLIPLKWLAEELKENYFTLYSFLRTRQNLYGYKYVNVILVDKEKFLQEWNHKKPAGRPRKNNN